MTVVSVLAEERALEFFFAEVAMEPNIEVLCRKRKPNSCAESQKLRNVRGSI
jgi:hypothetical protein